MYNPKSYKTNNTGTTATTRAVVIGAIVVAVLGAGLFVYYKKTK